MKSPDSEAEEGHLIKKIPFMFVLPGISCVYRVLIMNTINFGERNSGPQVGVNNGVINLGAGRSATAMVMGLC